MKIHQLKTLENYFLHVRNKSKTFEIRLNDRDYKVGDILILQEYRTTDDGKGERRLTGEIEVRMVSYVTDFAQKEGYVVLALDDSFTGPINELATIDAGFACASCQDTGKVWDSRAGFPMTKVCPDCLGTEGKS